MPTALPTLAHIQQALAIAERIQKLEEELQSIVGFEAGNGRTTPATGTSQPVKRGPGRPRKDASPLAAQPAKPGRKPFSAESRAKMAAAQRARWAKKNGRK